MAQVVSVTEAVLQLQEQEAEAVQVVQQVAQVQLQVQEVQAAHMVAVTEDVKLLFKQVQVAAVQLELSIIRQAQASRQLM